MCFIRTNDPLQPTGSDAETFEMDPHVWGKKESVFISVSKPEHMQSPAEEGDVRSKFALYIIELNHSGHS